MNLEDRIAILKMAGYEISEVPEHKIEPEEYYAWVVKKSEGTVDEFYQASDDLEDLLLDAWGDYEENRDEKAS